MNNLRMILNFGHTFGHAFEATTNFSNKINHGESVLLGMLFAVEFAFRNKILKNKDFNLIKKHYSALNLPNKIDEFDKYIKSPFSIFEKKKFLDQKFYNELRDSFPEEELFTKTQKKGLKISLDNSMPAFTKFILKNKPWETFYNFFNSKKNNPFILQFNKK